MSDADHLAKLKARKRELKLRIQAGDPIVARTLLEKVRAEIFAIEFPPINGAKS